MQETCKKHRTMMPQSPLKQAPWDLTQFSQSPSPALLYVPESHQLSEIASLSEVILVLGKARGRRAPNLGCRGAESPGEFDVSPKTSALDMMMSGCVVMVRLPITTWSYGLNHLNSFHRGMFQLNAKFDADLLLCLHSHFSLLKVFIIFINIKLFLFFSNFIVIQVQFSALVILNETVTRYTCSLKGIYHPP